MAFVNIFDLSAVKKGGSRLKDGCDVAVAYSAKKKHRARILIKLSKDILNKMRWIEGDRIEFLFDPDDNSAMLRRTQPENRQTYKLSTRAYRTGAGLLNITAWSGSPYSHLQESFRLTEAENVAVDGDKLLFILPGTPFKSSVKEKARRVLGKAKDQEQLNLVK